MTITNHTDIWEVECDVCETTQEYDRPTRDFDHDYFYQMIQDLKDEGWSIFKDSMGNWQHLCLTCIK